MDQNTTSDAGGGIGEEAASSDRLGKQIGFFATSEVKPTKYTREDGSPLYIPRDRQPHILELRDGSRVHALTRAIEASTVSEEEKRFLVAAAQRHAVFNYELIADYYAHATPAMQRLMEDSALVIVDVEDAIARGYVRLCDTVRKLYLEELADEDDDDGA